MRVRLRAVELSRSGRQCYLSARRTCVRSIGNIPEVAEGLALLLAEGISYSGPLRGVLHRPNVPPRHKSLEVPRFSASFDKGPWSPKVTEVDGKKNRCWLSFSVTVYGTMASLDHSTPNILLDG